MNKPRLSSKPAAKVIAYILAMLGTLCVILSAVAITIAWNDNFYRAELSRILYDEFRSTAISECDIYVSEIVVFDRENTVKDLSSYRNLELQILDHDGQELVTTQGYPDTENSPYQYQFAYRFWGGNEYPDYIGDYEGDPKKNPLDYGEYVVRVHINDSFPYNDQYRTNHTLFTTLYQLRYTIFVIAAAGLLVALVSFIFLMCGAGHRAGKEDTVPGPLYRIPFDLLTGICFVIGCVLLAAAGTVFSFRTPWGLIVPVCLGLVGVLMSVWWCTEFACRVKLGKWWRNTILYRVYSLVKSAVTGIAGIIRGIPLVPKVLITIVVWCILEFLGISWFHRNSAMLIGLWFLSRLFMGGFLLYVALVLRKLETGGKKLAAGDLSYKTDTRNMPAALASHGNNLNSIAQGMQAAVNEQLKSERMKTELITNVSHDIKTPLTSIINYADLLQKEHSAEEEQEYLAVLDRHAKKLKKLTEDLVEVSKASSGTMETAIAKHSMSEMLRQAVGEYRERMGENKLECMLTMPEEELSASFDGKLMWRVLDNLFSNVCKYAMPGTRVYVDLEKGSGNADDDGICLSIKNISRDPLNITADELTERFVRGDASRSGEGSGLGLHIAKSLTEMMNGSFDVTVDGDLFKVSLCLPQ